MQSVGKIYRTCCIVLCEEYFHNMHEETQNPLNTNLVIVIIYLYSISCNIINVSDTKSNLLYYSYQQKQV